MRRLMFLITASAILALPRESQRLAPPRAKAMAASAGQHMPAEEKVFTRVR